MRFKSLRLNLGLGLGGAALCTQQQGAGVAEASADAGRRRRQAGGQPLGAGPHLLGCCADRRDTPPPHRPCYTGHMVAGAALALH